MRKKNSNKRSFLNDKQDKFRKFLTLVWECAVINNIEEVCIRLKGTENKYYLGILILVRSKFKSFSFSIEQNETNDQIHIQMCIQDYLKNFLEEISLAENKLIKLSIEIPCGGTKSIIVEAVNFLLNNFKNEKFIRELVLDGLKLVPIALLETLKNFSSLTELELQNFSAALLESLIPFINGRNNLQRISLNNGSLTKIFAKNFSSISEEEAFLSAVELEGCTGSLNAILRPNIAMLMLSLKEEIEFESFLFDFGQLAIHQYLCSLTLHHFIKNTTQNSLKNLLITALQQLISLTYLDISNNEIDDKDCKPLIPFWTTSQCCLEKLYLLYTKIRTFDEDILGAMNKNKYSYPLKLHTLSINFKSRRVINENLLKPHLKP